MKWPIIFLVGILVKAALDEYKFKTIPNELIFMNLVGGSMLMLIYTKLNILILLRIVFNVAVVFGLMGLLYNLFKERISWGVILLISTLGVYFSVFQVLRVMFYAGLLASILGMYIAFYRKDIRRYEIPFIPFILLGVIIQSLF